MKQKILDIDELKKYSQYIWSEINIGCSDTNVYKLTKNNKNIYLKVGKSGLITNEYLNLKLLKEYIKAPEIIYYYNNEIEILITTEMKGKMSCDNEYINNNPENTINILCTAIKELQSIELDDNLKNHFLKFDIDKEINIIKSKISSGIINKIPEKDVFNKFKNLDEIIIYLDKNKPEGKLYLSHGDVSMPNVFINDNKLEGFIDIGNAGIRQKWYDITDLYISIRRNFQSQELADKFLNQLGIYNKKHIEYYEILFSLSY